MNLQLAFFFQELIFSPCSKYVEVSSRREKPGLLLKAIPLKKIKTLQKMKYVNFWFPKEPCG